MTKSAQIMALYAQGKSTREIADHVGCDPAYVRVVARQRKGGRSDIDRRYLKSEHGRQNYNGFMRRLWHSLPVDQRLAIRKQAYRAARDAGHSVQKSSSIAAIAVRAAALRTRKEAKA